MMNQTFIIEKINLGKAQQAYDNFSEVENRFHAQVNDYQSILNEISNQDFSLIEDEEVQNTDALAIEIEKSLEQYQAYTRILDEHFDKIHTDCVQMKSKILSQEAHFFQNNDAEYSLRLMEEAIVLKENRSILNALDRIMEAKESLMSVFNSIMLEWFITHQQYLSGLKDITDTKKMGGNKNVYKMLIS